MIYAFILPSQVFSVLSQILEAYYFLIVARVILSWFVSANTLENHSIGRYLCLLTKHFLAWCRRLPFAVIAGVVDISPLFALLIIKIAQRFLDALRASQSDSFGAVFLGMLILLATFVVNLAKIAAIICALILLFRLLHAVFTKRVQHNTAIGHIDSGIRKLLRGPFSSLQNKNFTVQVTVLLIVASLASYLLVLAEGLLKSL